MHSGLLNQVKLAAVHTHPNSNEVICELTGSGQRYCGDRRLDIDAWDVLLAPCGVHHSTGGSRDPDTGRGGGIGFASPPQLDLYLRIHYYKDGKFEVPS